MKMLAENRNLKYFVPSSEFKRYPRCSVKTIVSGLSVLNQIASEIYTYIQL